MVKITLQNNVRNVTNMFDENKTPEEIFAEAGMTVDSTVVHMNGGTLSKEDLKTPLKNLGVGDTAFMVAVTKTSNA